MSRVFRSSAHCLNMVHHISDTDLERYYLGMISEGRELAAREEHLLVCFECVERAKQSDDYIDAIRAAGIIGDYDPRDLRACNSDTPAWCRFDLSSSLIACAGTAGVSKVQV